MKSAASGLVVALLLFAVGAVASAEARLTRRVAASHQRLATLHFDDADSSNQAPSVLDRIPLPQTAGQDIEAQHATASYWLARYEVLTPLTGASGNRPATDPGVLLVAANAAFRSSHPEAGEHKAAAERLDGVVQVYADVLRLDPNRIDAAYNYEYVAKLRDTLAKNTAPAKAVKGGKAPAPAADNPLELPEGPTLHGRPGAPPPELQMGDFKTLTPMRFDEREEQMTPGKGGPPKRRG